MFHSYYYSYYHYYYYYYFHYYFFYFYCCSNQDFFLSTSTKAIKEDSKTLTIDDIYGFAFFYLQMLWWYGEWIPPKKVNYDKIIGARLSNLDLELFALIDLRTEVILSFEKQTKPGDSLNIKSVENLFQWNNGALKEDNCVKKVCLK